MATVASFASSCHSTASGRVSATYRRSSGIGTAGARSSPQMARDCSVEPAGRDSSVAGTPPVAGDVAGWLAADDAGGSGAAFSSSAATV